MLSLKNNCTLCYDPLPDFSGSDYIYWNTTRSENSQHLSGKRSSGPRGIRIFQMISSFRAYHTAQTPRVQSHAYMRSYRFYNKYVTAVSSRFCHLFSRVPLSVIPSWSVHQWGFLQASGVSDRQTIHSTNCIFIGGQQSNFQERWYQIICFYNKTFVGGWLTWQIFTIYIFNI